MTGLDYKSRQRNFREEGIESLKRIVPSENHYEAEQKYERLIKNIDERLRKSGHSVPSDNIMSIIIEEILRLSK